MMLPKVRGLGLRVNGPFWARYVRNLVIPELAVLRETVVDRALPSFDKIGDEADEAADAALEKMGRYFHPDDDPADMYEAANDAAILYYDLRRSAHQALLNLFAVALHHLLEQKLLFLLRKELLPKEHENNQALLKRSAVVEALADQGVLIAKFPEWQVIEELRLVANVAKHADGPSADQLWALRPDLFLPEVLRHEIDSPLASFKTQVMTPMSGDDLFVSRGDLDTYFQSVETFCQRLADELDAAAT